MGVTKMPDYGNYSYKVYPITGVELNSILLWAALCILIVPIPFAVCSIIGTVLRLKRETKFDTATR